ncbi:flagellar assembly protein FliW [Paenibacillus barcinonensis]|uniref:Flagellar assembly factor FliW n=1 Tax=Paenibacillus silvae TaxID=1325358 RepID=A0ABQ1ZJF1_9BACL|nr:MULTISPECIES: flagellar assembly protein FliW [Paenibacillus]MBU5355382.1 flagellar assembly protein FliW [Paenibacillus barcinonensis]MDM5281326.1 flagellar assembly protein FliW [Paenibacillus silvae]GGH64444.1 flagellar assembly factor FliW [Paenibacillus silvae]
MSQQNKIENAEEHTVKETYVFPKGIPGFENLKTFNLQQHDEVFSLFSSVEESAVAFVTVNPFDFQIDYEFELSSENIEDLGVTDSSDVQVRCIVTLHEEIQRATVNLLAPIVFNVYKKVGKQIVLQNTDYKTRHALWADKQSLNKVGDF